MQAQYPWGFSDWNKITLMLKPKVPVKVKILEANRAQKGNITEWNKVNPLGIMEN